jgi:hypothetical protein
VGHSRRRTRDKDPAVEYFEPSMVTEVGQRLDVIGRPGPGVLASATLTYVTSLPYQSDIRSMSSGPDNSAGLSVSDQ